MQAYAQMKMQVKKEKLLAFSYLFVPLLFLGMTGRERERKKKEQVNDVIFIL